MSDLCSCVQRLPASTGLVRPKIDVGSADDFPGERRRATSPGEPTKKGSAVRRKNGTDPVGNRVEFQQV